MKNIEDFEDYIRSLGGVINRSGDLISLGVVLSEVQLLDMARILLERDEE